MYIIEVARISDLAFLGSYRFRGTKSEKSGGEVEELGKWLCIKIQQSSQKPAKYLKLCGKFETDPIRANSTI